MKKTAYILSNLLVSTLLAQAGNMFGPGPFRNGSPLTSGNDGSYQATARAQNVTGIFRFAYSGGTQTAETAQNSWIFFVNGRVVKGSVVANINESKIDGVLDQQAAESSFTTTGGQGAAQTVGLPYIRLSDSSSSASGVFSGKMNLKSPNGAFNGDGVLSPDPGQSGEVLAVDFTQTPFLDAAGNPVPDANGNAIIVTEIAATDTPWDTPPGTIPNTNFKFRGVRTSISSTSANSTAAN